MPRRQLSLEERNALERHAIGRGKTLYGERRGTLVVGYVEGFMDALKMTPADRKTALATEGVKPRRKRDKQLSLVDGTKEKVQ